MRKIIKNSVQCKHCNDIIESVHRYDFIQCSCKKIAIDGGTDYLRRNGEITDIQELSILELNGEEVTIKDMVKGKKKS